jgi:hypothetical protein
LLTLEAIAIGVVSGVIAGALLIAGASALHRIVLPWYRQLIYRGVDLSGEWRLKSGNPGQTTSLTLRQEADSLSGAAVSVPEGGVEQYGVRTFAVKGSVRERFVHFVLQHNDRQRLGIAVFLLQVVGDGRTLQGWRCMYEVQSSQIVAGEVSFKRVGPGSEHANLA